ncbi:MAG: M28 family peptidase [Alphaproteobacteria bacterium]|nr:M28 family peptidase [Alphaproteobacteria bacterium]
MECASNTGLRRGAGILVSLAGALMASPAPAAGLEEAALLSGVRQLTFEGARAGEGYFSRDGTQLIFQSEREPGNPFYQIYLMDLDTGDTRRLSNGTGKTTCAWIHPDGGKALFASTHRDPEALAKQAEELKARAAATGRRYSWSFDPHYDIFETPASGGDLVNLTNAPGYDAEGSWSPDGAHILFASNRQAYEGTLSAAEQEILERDPSYFMDLYVMRADGTGVRRLTDTPGYDGGPFYSHDGSRIVWRRFTPDGGSAEIYTMNADGTGQRAVTSLGAMSWAPYFHPSGDYIVFATSLHGFQNFELYIVDTAGARAPVRVTWSDGFDGLPVFSPDGTLLSWSSSRTPDRKPQIFIAGWNDAEARRLLGLDGTAPAGAPTDAAPEPPKTRAAIDPGDLRGHVEILASEDMEGRLTGTPGERRATAYVASVFQSLDLDPASDSGGWFENFDFVSAVSLGKENSLSVEGIAEHPVVDRDWRPLGLSAPGPAGPAEIVFAGYGIVAPAEGASKAYDSYGELDVAGKWVLLLRYLPEDIAPERRQHLHRYAELGYKAAVARSRGALGIIVASGPNAAVRDQLVPLSFEAAAAGATLAALSVSDGLADAMLAPAGKRLDALQAALDGGDAVAGFALPDIKVAAAIDLVPETGRGRNVLARLMAGNAPSNEVVVVGAHVDHLGRGIEGKSLARAEEKGQVHYGADDNASGVAALLEIAEYLADLKARGKLPLKRDILFAAWSGEELGILGSTHFTRSFAGAADRDSLHPAIAAYLNMDMIGRLDRQLSLQGVGSSSVWPREIEKRNVPVGLNIVTSDSAFMATDATAFYLKGVPVLNAFTGAHAEYSTPRDTPDTLNYAGMRQVARLIALIARSLATEDAAPDYIRQDPAGASPRRRTSRVYLGTIPDYTQTDVDGARISGVAKGGPAAAAGLKDGDIVVEMAGQTIGNIYDYSHALDGLKVDAPVQVVVLRDGRRVTLTLTPGARE